MFGRNYLIGALAVTVQVIAANSASLVADYEAYNAGAYGDFPNETYKSTDLYGPLFQLSRWKKENSGLNEGYLVFNWGYKDEQHAGPVIVRADDFSHIYTIPLDKGSLNAQIQTLDGKNVLTTWNGYAWSSGHSSGDCLVYDESYNLIYNFTATGLNRNADMHELYLTPEGTAIVTVYEPIPWDLTAVGGKKEDSLVDSIFQEINLKTGKPVFTWRASKYFPPEEAYGEYKTGHWGTGPDGWDSYHINSIEKSSEGNYLVSLRRHHTIVYVNGTSGDPIWIIGGHQNQYKDLSDGRATNFAFQHHAGFYQGLADIILFDNHRLVDGHGVEPEEQSRALHLQLHHRDKTVRIKTEYLHPRTIASLAQGSIQMLPNGNALVGWGTQATITEHDPQGKCIMEVETGPYIGQWRRSNYRVYWAPNWVGQPTTDPDIAVEGNFAYVSWNGATEVTHWKLVGGETICPHHDRAPPVLRQGFETKLKLEETADKYIRVYALDKDGNTLGRTNTIELKTGGHVEGGCKLIGED